SPVDPLRDEDARHERRADDEPRVRAFLPGRLRPRPELRRRRRDRPVRGLPVGRRLPADASRDQARLQLPQEVGVVGQLLAAPCPRLRACKTLNNYARSMQAQPTPLGKSERQRLIGSIVTRRRVGTQFELLEALQAAGCVVTQATISRDIRELRLEKTHDALGRPRYALPDGGRQVDPRETLASI